MESLHLFFLGYSALWILISDHLGMQYLRGKLTTIPAKQIGILHKLVWSGLIGMIATGFFLFWPARNFYLQDPVFLLKMGFVGVLVINGLFIGHLTRVATELQFRVLSTKQKALMLLSGGASATGWISAASIGFLWL